MRIIHYLLGIRLWEGGGARALIDICNALARRGHDVTMLTNDASDAPRGWNGAQGRPRYEVVDRNRLKLLTAKSAARTRELFREADVIHLHMPWDPICWQMGRIARWLGKPYFMTTHGTLDDWSMAQKSGKKKLYLSLFARGLLENATAVQSTARAEQDQSTKWYPRGTSVVIPYLFDLDNYRTLPGAELARTKFPDMFDDGPTVLFLSRLHTKKNPEALISAAELLRDSGERFKVLIAGRATLAAGSMPSTGGGEAEYERHLRELISRKGLESHVALIGFVTGDLKTSLYQAVDIFALPTQQENFGFVLVEAMVCGTPVITTKGVDIWPELELSGGAVIVDDDPRKLAEAIRSLLKDEKSRRDMGQRGKQWVERYLDPSPIISEYESLYQRALPN